MEKAHVFRVLAVLCIFNLHSHCAHQFYLESETAEMKRRMKNIQDKIQPSQKTSSQEETNSSCVLAEPPVNLTVKMAYCIFNSKKSGICGNITSNQYIYGNSDSLRRSELLISMFEGYLPLYEISEECLTILKVLYCRYLFPLCDISLKNPHPKRICRKTCEFALHVRCKKELVALRQIAELDPSFDRDMINCTTFTPAVGGEAPECYQHHLLPGDDTQSTDCYHGIGVGYRGNVNTTRTGRTCQAWSSQCPHRNGRIPEDVADGQNDSNMCRNPDSSAPGGPWCYTSDPKVRWEYCNVSRCPPRVPDAAPTSLKGHPINSSSIHISWEGIPPSSFKEQLLGYRIKYRRRESLSFNEVNVTSNVTKAVLSRLDPMTKYEVTVNGFNEVGHGRPGKVLVVRTLQSGEIVTDTKIRFVMDANFHSDLLNRSSKAFIDMEEKIRSSMKRHFNTSSNFKIYEIDVLRFSRGSVEAHVVVLLITSKRTSKAEILTHLTEGFDSSFKQELAISALIVEEKPPPPGNLEAKNVQTRYMILTWNKPKYGSYYQIDNYTIERKKEVSDNFTVAQTLPYTHSGLMIKDLDPATEYTIRLSSNNKYGRSGGVLLTQSTLPDRFLKRLILTIILPLSLATFFVIAVCLKFRPTCKATSVQMEKTVLWKRGSWLELPRSDVQLLEKLGEGAFGEAFKGRVRINGQVKLCAIKRLKENATETEKRDLINELKIMTTVGEHPNVISLIGACTEKEPVFVIVRLAQNGCLLNHLKKNRENRYVNVKERQLHFSDIDRLRIARDVADGMLHLSNKRCVHRDLATRNVLLGEDFVAMVSDFGLSRDVYESGEYENTYGGMLPVRWMALESLLDYTYNTTTDIWSFGVVLWEIESGGVTPYPGLTGMEVVDFLKSGQRLKQPDGCPDELYEMMTSCWHADPVQRPSFSDLVTSLEQQLRCRKDSLKKRFSENEEPGSLNLVAETED